ncbi:hypothetical protein [Enterobacter roggenkampii]|uniref:hypothetical protein n=1 Tax=Enterobacter roggenkampii TaxID=1812935 RepID=UPI00201A50BD|nr:hypothetical protein [Enterobacter roggenkampii]MCL5589859.1 hypothetical protein [Enterobacter roggenkampii]
MNDKRTVSTIDLALQKHDTPAGPLFVAERHGRIKKCFSRDTAIRYLAFFMTSRAFGASGFEQRYPDVKKVHPDIPDLNCWLRGDVTLEYREAHQRCVRRLRRILARKREIRKWYSAWDALHDQLTEMKACRPF